MRNFSKLMTGSMIMGAALLVSACGGSETANTADTNMTEMNSMEPMDGTMNDVTAVDGAMTGDNMAMSNDMSMGNMSNDMMMSNDMSMGNTTNAM